MKKLNQFLKNAFNKQIDGTGLAIFRMAYSLVLLCEIAQMYYFKELIFDKVPFIEPAEISFAIPISLWFISMVFILFGAFTRFFTILNYFLSLILVGSITTFEYHVFYSYIGINFMLIFMPVARCFSIDRLIEKLRYSNTTYLHTPSKNVRQFYYFIVPFVGLGIVYIDSVFYKIVTPMWYQGLGSWLPSSLPMITHTNNSLLLNQEWLIKGIGWFTVIFETVFTFIFFRKKWRWFTLFFGLSLHLGILLIFPIPWFALIACVVYMLIIPISFWKKIFSKNLTKPTLFVFYDTECPLCVRTKITVNHLDYKGKIAFKTAQFDASDYDALKDVNKDELLDNIYSLNVSNKVFNGIDTYIQILSRIWYLNPISLVLRVPGIYHFGKMIYNYVAKNRTTERCTEENCGFTPPQITDVNAIKLLNNLTIGKFKLKLWTLFTVFVCVTQFIAITHSWSFEKLRDYFNVSNTQFYRLYNVVSHKYIYKTQTFLGLTHHQVFTDRIHFNNYNHIVSVIYQDKIGNETWLPIIDKNGQPDLYIYGSNWVNWTFRVDGMLVNQSNLLHGIEIYTAFWAKKNNIDLKDATFLIKVKKIDAPNGWEKDFLNKQIAKPWIDGGYVQWKNNKMNSFIKDIESL